MTEVSKVFADMIYDHGFVHCDPHPGNVLVRAKPGTKNKAQIVLLDHGLYKELNQEFKYVLQAQRMSLVDAVGI
jgi:aarF domain-containing kinase